jgi:hypothetical protein
VFLCLGVNHSSEWGVAEYKIDYPIILRKRFRETKLNEKKNKAAVLFDSDGVLVDADEWHFDALNRALKPHGLAITREQHLYC